VLVTAVQSSAGGLLLLSTTGVLQLTGQVLIVDRGRCGIIQAIDSTAIALAGEPFSFPFYDLTETDRLALIQFWTTCTTILHHEQSLRIIGAALSDYVMVLTKLQALIQEVGCVSIHGLRAFLEAQVIVDCVCG